MLILPKILLSVRQLVFAQLTNTNLVVVWELGLQKAVKLLDPVAVRTFCLDVNLEVFGGLYVEISPSAILSPSNDPVKSAFR